jgi:signal transduction histidine kinase
MPKTAAAEARSPCLRAIRIHIDEMTEPAPLDGDLLLVERLVANLLANAVRHNEADGRVEVTTGRRTARPSCR